MPSDDIRHTLKNTHNGPLKCATLCGSAGLCGGSASGKTTVANKIIEALDVPWVVLLSMDSFYKVRESCLFSPYFVFVFFGSYQLSVVSLLEETIIFGFNVLFI